MTEAGSSPTLATPDEAAQRMGVRAAIAESAALTAPSLVMNALATVVACYGLLANSTAVVIGAMLIAMLIGPIMGIALALVDGDSRLLWSSVRTELAGALIVLSIALLVGRVHRALPLTPEMLARTRPNLLDLAIALAGGAAGALAGATPSLGVGLVGVAIATALLPPLATCGLCLARGATHLAAGSATLYVANLVAIQFASSIVLALHGFHRLTRCSADRWTYAGRLAASGALLLALAVGLGVSFARSTGRGRFEAEVRSRLVVGVRSLPGAHLTDVRFQRIDGSTLITAVVRTPEFITPAAVAQLERTLPTAAEAGTQLHVRSVLTREATSDGYLHRPETAAEAEQSDH